MLFLVHSISMVLLTIDFVTKSVQKSISSDIGLVRASNSDIILFNYEYLNVTEILVKARLLLV